MHPVLLNLLCCPACRGRLTVEAFVEGRTAGQISEGLLTCRCGASYPIVRTIPRLLRDAYTLFPEFVATYNARLPQRAFCSDGGAGEPSFNPAIARTRESFG